MSGTRALAHSYVDPFNYTACIPDSSIGTGCFTTRNTDTLTIADGATCILYALNLSETSMQTYKSSGDAGGVPDVSGNWSPANNNVTLATLYAKARPISGGIKANYIGPTLNDQGMIIVGYVSGQVPLVTFNALTLQQAQVKFMKYKSYPLRQGCTITWRPDDFVDHDFHGVDTTAHGVDNPSELPYLVLIVYGTISGGITPLHIESVVNYEGQFENQNFMPGGVGSGTRPAEIGWYERARNLIAGVESISQYIPQAVNLGRAAAPYLANGMQRLSQLGASGMPLLLGG